MTTLHPLLVFSVVPHVYAGALIALTIRKRDAWQGAPFSWLRFYVLMGWAPLTYAALAVFVDWRYLVMFVACGVAGVAGELIVSVVWRVFFGPPIWTYSHGAFAAGFSSTLNFLPWAVGAFVFHVIAIHLGATSMLDRGGLARAVVTSIAALAVGACVCWPWIIRARGTFTKRRFAVFCLPILLTMIALVASVDWRFAPLMLLFAVGGFVTEYGYGRMMSVFFARSLWRYNPWPLDHGHASPVSIPLWALGGLFFFFITEALMSL